LLAAEVEPGIAEHPAQPFPDSQPHGLQHRNYPIFASQATAQPSESASQAQTIRSSQPLPTSSSGKWLASAVFAIILVVTALAYFSSSPSPKLDKTSPNPAPATSSSPVQSTVEPHDQPPPRTPLSDSREAPRLRETDTPSTTSSSQTHSTKGPSKSSAQAPNVATVDADARTKRINAALTEGDLFYEKGEYDNAVKAYTEGLNVDPSNAELQNRMHRGLRAKAAEQSVNSDASSVTNDQGTTKDKPQVSRSEMGTLIARNHDEIEDLRRQGERDYFESMLTLHGEPKTVGPIQLELMGAWGIGSVGGPETEHFDIKHMLYDLLAGVTMLLLIACSGVANLLLARAAVREKEIAVRSAFGATRWRLVRQLLVESSVLAIAACALGCLLAYFGMKGVAAVVPHKGQSIGGEAVIGLDFTVLFFTLAVTAATTVVCGLAPALHVVGHDLQPRLTGSGKGTGGSFRHGKFRAGLVIVEVALSIVLLTGAGLMIRSFYELTHIELGFNAKNLLFVATWSPLKSNSTPEKQGIILKKVVND
jgi:hypothetical protein